MRKLLHNLDFVVLASTGYVNPTPVKSWKDWKPEHRYVARCTSYDEAVETARREGVTDGRIVQHPGGDLHITAVIMDGEVGTPILASDPDEEERRARYEQA